MIREYKINVVFSVGEKCIQNISLLTCGFHCYGYFVVLWEFKLWPFYARV